MACLAQGMIDPEFLLFDCCKGAETHCSTIGLH